MAKLPIYFQQLTVDGQLSKNQVFEQIGKILIENHCINDVDSAVGLFNDREKDGSTLIEDEFALPHIEDTMIDRSAIVLLRHQTGISWQEGHRVNTILAIVLRPDEEYITKGFIVALMRKLAFEETIAILAEKPQVDVEHFLRNIYLESL